MQPTKAISLKHTLLLCVGLWFLPQCSAPQQTNLNNGTTTQSQQDAGGGQASREVEFPAEPRCSEGSERRVVCTAPGEVSNFVHYPSPFEGCRTGSLFTRQESVQRRQASNPAFCCEIRCRRAPETDPGGY